MIKLPNISICGLGKLCFLVAAMLFSLHCSAQIEYNFPNFINSNPGGDPAADELMSYLDLNSFDVSGCTSISFSMQYDSDPWAGGGNLESVDECAFAPDPCLGDPLDPLQGSCDGCWDFLFYELEVNGSVELDDLYGSTNLSDSETITWNSGCIDPTDSYEFTLNAFSQTWGAGEDINLTNIMILCYQGVVEDDVTIDPSDELCEGENLSLTVDPAFSDADWYFGGVNIGTGTDININGITTAESGLYTVEATDDNGCISSVEFNVDVLENPMSCPVFSSIELCIGVAGFSEIDLTAYDEEVNCNTGDEVIWFETQANIPTFPIIDPTTFQSDGSDLYALVFNGLCYSAEQQVFIDFGNGIEPDIDIDNTTICGGENLVFTVMDIPSCGTCTFEWDGPPSSGIVGDLSTTEIYQVLNANDDMTGTWTVTVTDDTGCSGTATVDVIVSAEPSGTISGGGVICPGSCTDASNELTLDITGGTAPYVATLQVEVGIFNGEFDIPSFLPNGTISLCADPTAFVPSITDFDGDGVDDLVVPAIGFLAIDFSVTLVEVTDDIGCVGPGVGTIQYTINTIPDANDPGGPYAQCTGMTFDLTTYDNNINGSELVLWFEDMSLTSPIIDPTNYTPGTSPMTVYAVVNDGVCQSDPVSLELIETPQPALDPIDDAIACESYEFIQPAGTDLGINIFYQDASGTMFLPGDITTESGTYTVTAGDDPACLDMETFEITVLDQPTITFPTTELTACGEIILPEIMVINYDVTTGVVGYFEDEDQGGQMFSEDDPIDQTLGLTSLFVYVGTTECNDEIEIDLIFSNDIEYVLPGYPSDACGDFELLPIGGATPGVAYYTEEDGSGVEYQTGDFLEAPGVYTLYVYDLDIDQTCVINGNESFEITLEAEPIFEPLDDVTVCESEGFMLPVIQGTNLTGDEGYATEPGGGGTGYEEGETIFESTTIFIYNVAASCPATEIIFEVTVIPTPNAGDGDDYQTCIGPTLDLNSYLSSDADLGGVFVSEDSSVSLSGADLSLWNTSGADENTPYLFTYTVADPTGICDDEVVEFSIELTNDVSAGIALPDSTVCQGDMIDLFGLIDGESSGGFFLDQNNLLDTIFSGEWMASGIGSSFSYIIEADGGCNGDQSTFDVNVIEAQMVTVDIPILELCEDKCVEMVINSNFSTALDFQLVEMNTSDVYDFNVGVDGIQIVEICADGIIGFDGSTITLGEEEGDFVIAFAFLQNVEDCETDLSNLDNFNIEVITAFEQTIVGEVCENEGFMYEGEEYFDDVVLTGFTAAGCDSTTIIEVIEFAPAENFENDTYCIGTEVFIGGEMYTEDTQLDVVLMGASANGCDSTIYIDIAFDNASYNDVIKTICIGDSEELNDVMYDFDNPMGADTLINGSVLGCDSIITVMLDFYPEAFGQEDETICQGDTVNILGVDFYAGLEQMDVILENESANGCDSTVTVMIDFYSEALGQEQQTICQGDTINILGVDFYAGLEQMDVVLGNQSVDGCDSIVSVSIDFFPTMEIDTLFEKCQGDTLDIDGFEITDDNLIGFYALASSGTDCSTIVNYTTELLPASFTEIDTTVCQGTIVEISGITFDEFFTFDQVSYPTASGCDSTVTITVNFEPASVTTTSELVANNSYQLNYVEVGVVDPVWSSSVGNLSCQACEDPTIIIEENTEIYFSGLSANGCLVSDTLLLNFLPEEVFIGIYTPNVFTPDDDNFNNVYTIYGTDGFTILEMSIYDRWGNLVFVAEDFLPNNEVAGWDGRINGVEAAIGVYVGKIIYEEADGTEDIKVFDLTLLR